MKIISHFFLAMPASLTATRDSGDSKRGNFLEKSFRSVINSGDQHQESNARDCQRVLLTRYTQAKD
jgi:hypothetical protein